MARSGFKRAFVCLKTAFLSCFQVPKVAVGQLGLDEYQAPKIDSKCCFYVLLGLLTNGTECKRKSVYTVQVG